MSDLRIAFCAALAASAAACSAAGEVPGTTTVGTTSSSATTSETGGETLFDAGDGDGGPGCTEAAKLVYLLSQEGSLYSFFPPTLAFQKIGTLACPAGGASPWSMAVDRNAVAWVLYDDGSLFHVSTEDASCTPTAFANTNPSFSVFGMGFVADAPGSEGETLYAAAVQGNALGVVDTEALKLSVVGDWDAIFESAELTGTASGKLYGFFTTSPPIVAEIDRQTAKILSQVPQPSVDIGSAWAFAHWGGDFWLFSSPGVASRVDRYRPSDGTTLTMSSNVGFHIVGAGVSTCAPLTPPE